MENTITKNRVAQYLRCSTEEQVINGYGLEIQREKNNALATLKDYEVNEECIYADEGMSGTLPPEQRPALNKMLEDAEKGKFEVLIVYKIDRIARDNYITLGVVKKLTSYGVKLISATEPFDTSTTIGNYMVQLLGATAEMDRNNIVERTTAGRMLSAKKGTWVFGSPPYGYRHNKETQRLEIIEDEAKYVKNLYEWLVYEQIPLREIAARLNNLKIPSPLISSKSSRTSTGLWYPRTIGRILSNDAYVGVKYLGKFKKSPKNYKMVIDPRNIRPKDEWVAVNIPPIVSDNLYQSALRQLKRNSDVAKRKKIRDYMYSGLLICSDCGYKLRGGYAKPTSKTATGSRFYYSILKKKEIESYTSKKCKYCGSIAESRLMPIWHAIEKILLKPELIYKKLEQFSKKDSSETQKESLVVIRKKREELSKERERLNVAFIEVGSIDGKEYRNKLHVIDEKLNNLAREETGIIGVTLSKEELSHGKDRLVELFKQYKGKLENASYEMQTRILQTFVNNANINLASNVATIQLNLAGTDFLRDNSRRAEANHHSE